MHPHFEEEQQKVAQLVEKIDQNKNAMSREAAVKVLKTLANEKYKTGKNAQQSFCKNGAISKEQFMDDFINSRKEYYQLQSYIQIV